MVMEFINQDSIVQALEVNDLGIVLVNDNDLFRKLYKGSESLNLSELHRLVYGGITWKDIIDFAGNGKHIDVHLFPLMWVTKNPIITFAEARRAATNEIFTRWTDCGYNRDGERNPYHSKAFMQYLWDMKFIYANWMVLAK